MGVVGSGTRLYRARALSTEPPKSAYLRRVDMGAVEREDELADLELQPPFTHGCVTSLLPRGNARQLNYPNLSATRA